MREAAELRGGGGAGGGDGERNSTHTKQSLVIPPWALGCQQRSRRWWKREVGEQAVLMIADLPGSPRRSGMAVRLPAHFTPGPGDKTHTLCQCPRQTAAPVPGIVIVSLTAFLPDQAESVSALFQKI